jgi:allantoinase
MAIAMHCYLSGVPHRIAYVRRAFEEVMSKPGVAAWDGVRILEWYKKQAV